MIWFPSHIPKCSIITWLAVLNRMYTEDRLVLFGTKATSLCSLCPGSESHDHLFFNCPYTAQVWGSVLVKLNIHWAARTWVEWIELLSTIKGRSLRSIMIRLAFTTSVYHIWIERNCRKFQNIACSETIVIHKICSMMRFRLLSIGNLPQGLQSNWLINQWDLT